MPAIEVSLPPPTLSVPVVRSEKIVLVSQHGRVG